VAAPKLKPQAFLIIPNLRKRIPLADSFTVGRNQEFPDNNLSRQHFMVARAPEGHYFVKDMGSRGGTQVNGVAIPANEWCHLAEGSKISAGSYTFVFSFQEEKRVSSVEKMAEDIIAVEAGSGDNNFFLIGIASINLIIHGLLIMFAGGGFEPETGLLKAYGANVPYLSTGSEWWRLFSYAFLHGSIAHLLGNVVAIYFAAAHLGRYLSSSKIAVVYIGSAAIAGMASALAFPPYMVSVGASGAIFGLYGSILACVILFRNKGIKPNMWLMITAGQFALQNLGWGVSGIDYWCHLGGLIAGALITVFVVELVPENNGSDTAKMMAGFAAVLAVLIVSLPHRKLSPQQQFEPFIKAYTNNIGVYYKTLKSIRSDAQIPSAVKFLEKEYIPSMIKLRDEVRREKPVNSAAQQLQSLTVEAFDNSIGNAHYLNHFYKTSSKKSLSIAGKYDKLAAQSMRRLFDQVKPIP